MVSEQLDLIINLETYEAMAEVRNLQIETDKVAAYVQKQKRETVSALNDTLRMANVTLNVMKNVVVAMGGTIDPASEAMFALIGSTLVTMQSVATAYATMGPVGWGAAAIIGIASIIFQYNAQKAALQGMDEARQQLNAASNVLEGVNILGRGLL